jgi:hypothetical protein
MGEGFCDAAGACALAGIVQAIAASAVMVAALKRMGVDPYSVDPLPPNACKPQAHGARSARAA